MQLLSRQREKLETSRISSLETREEIRFIESFGFSNIDSSLVGNLRARFSVGACRVRKPSNRAIIADLTRVPSQTCPQRCETASVACIRARTIISLINPVGLARQLIIRYNVTATLVDTRPWRVGSPPSGGSCAAFLIFQRRLEVVQLNAASARRHLITVSSFALCSPGKQIFLTFEWDSCACVR